MPCEFLGNLVGGIFVCKERNIAISQTVKTYLVSVFVC